MPSAKVCNHQFGLNNINLQIFPFGGRVWKRKAAWFLGSIALMIIDGSVTFDEILRPVSDEYR
jgi:hypothetical protein